MAKSSKENKAGNSAPAGASTDKAAGGSALAGTAPAARKARVSGFLAGAGRSVLSVGFLLPAALTCFAVGVTASNYSPLIFDPSQYAQQQSSVKKMLEAGELELQVVDESKRTTDTQTSEQKAKAAASSNYGMKAPAGGYTDGVYTAKSYGYRSYITVQVTIKGGKISGIKVLSESEDRPYFSNAKAVISRVISKQGTNVDTVSGATYSSKGILAAVKKCLIKASKSKATKEKVEENKPDTSQDTADDGKTSWGDNSSDTKGDTGYQCRLYANGTWTGEGEGYEVLVDHGDTKITLQVTTLDDKITGIKIVSHAEDFPYFRYATRGKGAKLGVIEQVLNKQTSDVDVVSGATYSSKGLMAAIADALDKAKAALEEQSKKDDADKDGGKDDSGKDDSSSDKGDSGKDDSSSSKDDSGSSGTDKAESSSSGASSSSSSEASSNKGDASKEDSGDADSKQKSSDSDKSGADEESKAS
ncbi:MAG: FMN-binding protein [Coriobacteriia bacterium]|nr:FMN-binding protein [Coriobacteriia bacterium]